MALTVQLLCLPLWCASSTAMPVILRVPGSQFRLIWCFREMCCPSSPKTASCVMVPTKRSGKQTFVSTRKPGLAALSISKRPRKACFCLASFPPTPMSSCHPIVRQSAESRSNCRSAEVGRSWCAMGTSLAFEPVQSPLYQPQASRSFPCIIPLMRSFRRLWRRAA